MGGRWLRTRRASCRTRIAGFGWNQETASSSPKAPGLSLAPLTPEIAIDSTRLPGELHTDPSDRILVATARRLDATLLTRDHQLLEYGRRRYARIVSA